MPKMKKIVSVTIIVIVSLLAVILVAGGLLVHSYLSKIQYETGDQGWTPPNLSDEEILENLYGDQINSDKPNSDQAEIDKLEQEMESQLNNPENDVFKDKDIFNILLIGSDTRETFDIGRSDAMILISVNKETKKIHMTSLMRDSYVSIPGKGNNLLNAAYAFGGGELLLDTIETNFAVDVDKYVAVDFNSFVEIVDIIGGIEIDVTEAEVLDLNQGVIELNRLNGRAEDTDCLTKSGLQHLNGAQALAYARIRYVGNADFERTSRQREVMTKVFEKVKTINVLAIHDLLNGLLPYVKTNLSQKEILSLMLKAPDYLKYSLESHRLPIDGSWKYMRIDGLDALGIDLKMNQDALKEFITQ